MVVGGVDPHCPWCDKVYPPGGYKSLARLTLRGVQLGESFIVVARRGVQLPRLGWAQGGEGGTHIALKNEGT